MKFENIYKETEENMRLALHSLWTPGSHPMRKAIEELFDREPLLAEPVFQSTFGWEPTNDDSWKSALNSDVVKKLNIGAKYAPYKHQASSWKTLADGKSIVVTSGTGSGKTECFMYPVLSDLYEQGNTNAIQAIFLYPLNALMEDQKKRLSEYCEATRLKFAVYNGDTPEYHADGRNDILPCEVATRDDIRDSKNAGTRPAILLSNPSMLEYILVRQKDQQMLKESEGKLRWIVIDEAHSYSGSAAVELAYQIKRILEAFGVSAKDVRFACTSATIGGEDGAKSLAEFISTITGQPVDQIKVIGGKRLVRPLDKNKLSLDLKHNNLPAVERVLSLREKINVVSGMSLQQIWEWLCPEVSYNKQNLLQALRLLDQLCEIEQDGKPVLSLRAHFFMRAINGLYACANDNCTGKNPSVPLYGHLTTYKASVCPDCGKPLLEIVQCKRCGGFVLMGCSDRNTKKIYPCDEGKTRDDYFSIDTEEDEEDNSEFYNEFESATFFFLPYNKGTFYNPVEKSDFTTFDINHSEKGSTLDICPENNGKWVEVRKSEDNHTNRAYCPSCGQIANGKRLNLKHFRIPINFINQTISPVFLKECAPKDRSWGKYIAFTDSRQGTAISAKTFNINVERIQSRQRMLDKLVAKSETVTLPPEILALPDNVRQMIVSSLQGNKPNGLSLYEISDKIYDKDLFYHIAGKEKDADKRAYKAALMRQIIGRKPLYENNAENMGLIKLVYPALKKIKCPASISDYTDKYGGSITEEDWHDFLKIALDYFFRRGNHIQPLIESERKYVRDSNIGKPVTAPEDPRPGMTHWPSVDETKDGVSAKQNRFVLLLCAKLGITTLSDLQDKKKLVSNIMKDAWNDLVENKILSVVKADDTEGYNDSRYHPDNEYVGCYYLDLSGNEDNDVCRIELAKEVKECPVTGKLLDTTFGGFSPLINGVISSKLFAKYKCSEDSVTMPVRPKENDDVDEWLKTNKEIQTLKEKGFWSDRHKYSYKSQPSYIAAEHSAQQSKNLLREYTKAFSQKNPSINVLHCSTTMEMGVDIGDIDIVLMDTIPPTAANYLQRVGRAGRMGQNKSIAFSLCNNTPVGQFAFANPMWALQTANHMVKVRPSQTIIQRHINSFFFRQFICGNGAGIQATITVDEFMTSTCKSFINYLDEMSTNRVEEQKFKKVFGSEASYTINITKKCIEDIQSEYNDVIKELEDAFSQFANDTRRQMAISNQIRKIKSESLLNYLSSNQFIPNANMPTGVVTFDFTDRDQSMRLHKLFDKAEKLKNKIDSESNDVERSLQESELNKTRKEIEDIKRSSTASRDIHTALNEYAPEQTVVVNEKNYVSAGIALVGAYKEETRTRGIYHCTHCGRTLYKAKLKEGEVCTCGNPYHSIIDRDHGSYTLAYEPIGFRTDQNIDSSREERTEKHYYDIRPVLLETDWSRHIDISMCEIISSGENGNILFYNVANGNGFAFCKRCGRAAIEYSPNVSNDSIPYVVRPGHKKLWGDYCEANNGDVARHVVFTGNHPTCYSVLRFKKDIDSSEYENDEQLVYSLGVILKRALAKSEGIDESEIDFGIKQEIDSWILFMYDTAKGGCGYSLRLANPVLCQEVFDIARQSLEDSPCNCHIDGGACTRCLVDRNNYRYAKLLSKSKVLDWFNKQKNRTIDVPVEIKASSPNATIVYQTPKTIFKEAINKSDVKKITICVSDLTDDYAITDWTSVRSEMGKIIKDAVSNGKEIAIRVEYHPELHTSLTDKLAFSNLKDKFPDCEICLIKDMGDLKTTIVSESSDKVIRYFSNDDSVLSFSNRWGDDLAYVFADTEVFSFEEQEEPIIETSHSQIIREGLTTATTFQVQNYFSKAIAVSVLKPQDLDAIKEVVGGKHVDISFSDMYVNSALASLMLVYLIDEMKSLFGFEIDNVMLQLDSPKRKCNNERFNDWTPISFNFADKDMADDYTDKLFQEVLCIDPEHSFNDADHHRWLKIETEDGGKVEIRPDHGISGGYKSDSKYMNLDSLNGNVSVWKNNEDVLYYVIIKKGNA